MTIEEFFAACKDKNSELSVKIESLRVKYDLEYIYPIHISILGFIWSFRGLEVDSPKLLLEIVDFTAEHAGLNYSAEFSTAGLLNDCVEEVEFLIDKEIREYVESHEGSIKLISVDENTGVVVIKMSGTCGGCAGLPYTMKNGVEKVLKERLHWVREVKLAEDESSQYPSAQPQNPPENSNDDISITDAAAKKIHFLVKEKNFASSAGLRIKVVPGGCSGFQYQIFLEDKPNPDDSVSVRQFTQNGDQAVGRVFVDKNSLQFVKGSALDYGPTPDGLGESFKIKNPNAKSSCGCGKSDSL